MDAYQIKPIKDFEGYFVDTNGDIWTMWKLFGYGNTRESRIVPEGRKLSFGLGGGKTRYYQVHLTKNKKVYARTVHRLVAETFLKNPEGYKCVCHNDNNSLNNKLVNLRWDTHKNNSADMKKFGTYKNGAEKLDENKVKKIMLDLRKGISPKGLADTYGVTKGAIYHIKNGLTWKQVQPLTI